MTLDRKILIDEFVADEGLRLKPYRCTAGKLTIGVGRNIEDNGISKDEAMDMLHNDINCVEAELLANFPWYRNLAEGRKRALVNMCFQLGISRLKGFRKMLHALSVSDYRTAAVEAQDSAWFKQTQKSRTDRVIRLIRDGR